MNNDYLSHAELVRKLDEAERLLIMAWDSLDTHGINPKVKDAIDDFLDGEY